MPIGYLVSVALVAWWTLSSPQVVYAELPGAQHSFDLFHSVRFETVVDAIEAFAAWVRSTRVRSRAQELHGQS